MVSMTAVVTLYIQGVQSVFLGLWITKCVLSLEKHKHVGTSFFNEVLPIVISLVFFIFWTLDTLLDNLHWGDIDHSKNSPCTDTNNHSLGTLGINDTIGIEKV